MILDTTVLLAQANYAYKALLECARLNVHVTMCRTYHAYHTMSLCPGFIAEGMTGVNFYADSLFWIGQVQCLFLKKQQAEFLYP